MKDLYQVAGITKQALYQFNQRESLRLDSEQKVVQLCTQVRRSHKRMSSRKIHSIHRDKSAFGRDKFEQVAFAYGFKVKVKRSMVKTTRAITGTGFDNLLEGLTLTGQDQAWASDIFYINVEGDHWYGISICDVYTRELLALYIARTMKAEDVEAAIFEAMKYRGKTLYPDCVFHTDRGTQYFSELIKKLLKEMGMKQSMCTLPQENAYAERVQGTIKIEYLQDSKLTAEGIKRTFRKIKQLYNQERPHLSLKKMPPAQFAKELHKVPHAERLKMKIYTWEHPLLTMEGLLTKEKSSKKEKVNINNI